MTKYYRHRLWKITWKHIPAGDRVRVVKHYEKRAAVGEPWQLVRSIVEYQRK